MWPQSLCLVMGVTGVSLLLSSDPAAGQTRGGRLGCQTCPITVFLSGKNKTLEGLP